MTRGYCLGWCHNCAHEPTLDEAALAHRAPLEPPGSLFPRLGIALSLVVTLGLLVTLALTVALVVGILGTGRGPRRAARLSCWLW